MRTGSRGVCAAPGLSSIFAASSTGPPSSKRRVDQRLEMRLVAHPVAVGDAGAAGTATISVDAGGRGLLLAGDLIDAVVHDDDGQVARLDHADGGETAERHQDRAVALERDHAALGLRERDAERDRTGQPHAAEHVEVLRAVAGREEIEIGVADARRSRLRRA